MGLRDFWRRITGQDRGTQRGVRRGRREVRRPDERTMQMGGPQGAWGAGGAPGAGAAPTVAAPVPPLGPPPTQPSAPPPTAPPPVAPPPAARPAAPAAAPAAASGDLSSAATQYMSVPSMPQGGIVGVLVAVEGELEGTVCAVRDGESKLGRAEDCEIHLASVKISREHSKVVHSDGVFAIVPLKPENPTYVNGEVTEGAELRDGDLVRVGNTTLRFRTIEGP